MARALTTTTTAAHAVTVRSITRNTHDLARVVNIARCGCGWRVESYDAEYARREAIRHGAIR